MHLLAPEEGSLTRWWPSRGRHAAEGRVLRYMNEWVSRAGNAGVENARVNRGGGGQKFG